MEDTLRGQQSQNESSFGSLNPCFNGRYSQSTENQTQTTKVCVLILVLMEDTLRELLFLFPQRLKLGLNPCFNGRYSQRY